MSWRVTSTQAPASAVSARCCTSIGVWLTILSSALWFQTSSSRGAMLRSPTRMARDGLSARKASRIEVRKSSFWPNFTFSSRSGMSPPAGT